MKFKLLLIIPLLFSSFAHSSAAEDRTSRIIQQATSSKYSSATGHNYTVGSVRAANDGISADISQRVVVDGSSATVKQKVHIPANDAFYKNTAKYAKNILKGGIGGLIAAAALDKLLDGVDYVMSEGGQIQKKPSSSDLDPAFVACSSANNNCAYSPYVFFEGSWTIKNYSSALAAATAAKNASGWSGELTTDGFWWFVGGSILVGIPQNSNPNYLQGTPPPTNSPTLITDSQALDAFANWFKNNPSSVTDPVTTYIYSPKNSDGSVNQNANAPSWGQTEITDEMMQNYIANRDAELYANDVAANQAAIRDSAQTETETNPDGSKTETTNNPDGSKTETKTDTKTNLETGEVVTTTTTTTTNPDGSTSVKTETSTQTKPNPETSKLPAACEYLAFLCEFTNWFKKEPEKDNDSSEVELTNPTLPNINSGLFKASGQCPPDFSYAFPLPNGKTHTITYSYSFACTWFSKLYYIVVTCAWIAAYMIVLGQGDKKNG